MFSDIVMRGTTNTDFLFALLDNEGLLKTVRILKGLLHYFPAYIEITGINWYCLNLKNVENCKEKFSGLKSYKEFKF